jgi:hypothetical protein
MNKRRDVFPEFGKSRHGCEIWLLAPAAHLQPTVSHIS